MTAVPLIVQKITFIQHWILCWNSIVFKYKIKLHFPCCNEKVAVKSHFSTWNCIFQWRPGCSSRAQRWNEQIVPTEIKHLFYNNIVISFEPAIFRLLLANTTAGCSFKGAHSFYQVWSVKSLMLLSEFAHIEERFGLIWLSSQISAEMTWYNLFALNFLPFDSFFPMFEAAWIALVCTECILLLCCMHYFWTIF